MIGRTAWAGPRRETAEHECCDDETARSNGRTGRGSHLTASFTARESCAGAICDGSNTAAARKRVHRQNQPIGALTGRHAPPSAGWRWSASPPPFRSDGAVYHCGGGPAASSTRRPIRRETEPPPPLRRCPPDTRALRPRASGSMRRPLFRHHERARRGLQPVEIDGDALAVRAVAQRVTGAVREQHEIVRGELPRALDEQAAAAVTEGAAGWETRRGRRVVGAKGKYPLRAPHLLP